jgi:hypothetical protein
MRKEWLAALVVAVVAVGAALADDLSQAVLQPSTPPTAGPVTDNGAKIAVDTAAGVTFGLGLPSQVPWEPPPFPVTTPNSPTVPLPYFSPPPKGPSPEQLARIPGGSRFWGGFEYLMWWDKKAPLPSDFITTGSPRDAVPGALGQPNTHVLYTSPVVDFYQIQGLRVTAGAWFDARQMLGLEGSGFLLEKRTHVFQARSDALGNPLLAFAHFDALPRGSPDAFVASEPRGGKTGPFTGSLGFNDDTQLWGTEANLVHALLWLPNLRVRLLGGFRYLDLDEHLAFFFQRATVGSATVPFLGRTFPSSLQLADDSFQVHNQFYGPQIGLDGQYFFGKVFVGLGAKLGMGATHEVLTVSGSSTLQQVRRPVQTAVGGLYALPSNIGRLEADQFGVVPQAQAQLGWQPVRWVRGWIGYDFLYWSQVLRPGSQVDLRVNPAEVPTDPGFRGVRTSSPAPQFNRTDFWTQGLSFGVELTF